MAKKTFKKLEYFINIPKFLEFIDKDKVPSLKITEKTILAKSDWVCINEDAMSECAWSSATCVLEVPQAGCFLRVTTEKGGIITEAVCFAPGIRLNNSRTGLVAG
jgi:hypothetical protein